MKAISAVEGCSAQCRPSLKRGDSPVKAISAVEGCSAECESNSRKRRCAGEGDLRR